METNTLKQILYKDNDLKKILHMELLSCCELPRSHEDKLTCVQTHTQQLSPSFEIKVQITLPLQHIGLA